MPTLHVGIRIMSEHNFFDEIPRLCQILCRHNLPRATRESSNNDTCIEYNVFDDSLALVYNITRVVLNKEGVKTTFLFM